MDYKRHKKVIQEKTETVRKIFEKEVPPKILQLRLKKIPRKNIFKKNLAFIKAILKIHGKL